MNKGKIRNVKSAKWIAGVVLLLGVTLFGACGVKTELDGMENGLAREKRYSEQVSETKQNDREVESELDAIMDAVDESSAVN